MPASIKNILIGIFVISALSIVIFMLLFLHPTVGDNAKTLRVQFTDVDKVTPGTRVTFAGRPVGEVVSIQEIPEIRTGRTSKRGEVYAYELVLKIDSGVDVFNTDQIYLRTSGLLGERNIEINPRPLLPGEKLQNIEHEILLAEQTASVEDTMKQFGELSKKFEQTLDDFHHLMEEIENEEIVKKISISVQNILEITQSLNQPEKYQKIIDNTLNWTERANQTWMQVDQAVEKFKTAGDNAIAFSEKADQIMTHIREGKGSLGQLAMGDDLYLRLKSIFNKGNVVANDINQYGLLYHLDKRWQRLQAKRLRLLEKLACPDEFARYFNEEMDQISSSLSNVSMVLTDSQCYPQSLMGNPEFTKRFAELLKRVEQMEESLKMYNEQVIDQESNPS